jgi:DNA-binding beta-propeller fold protein YncE
VAVFHRNTDSSTGPIGKLTQLGCVSETGSGGACADGKALDGASSVKVSGDGKNVYLASITSDAVAAFSRNTTTGELAQLGGTTGCTSETGSGGDCADGKALDGADGLAISPDGYSLYAAAFDSDAVAAFRR